MNDSITVVATTTFTAVGRDSDVTDVSPRSLGAPVGTMTFGRLRGYFSSCPRIRRLHISMGEYRIPRVMTRLTR